MEPNVEPISGGFRVTATVQLPPLEEDEPVQQPAPDVVGAVVRGAAAVLGGVMGAVVTVLRPNEREPEEDES